MSGWQFTDERGTFRLENPHHTSALYFPLVNEAGMMSVVTPTLHGDAKTGQHSFLLPPVSVEDLRTSRSARNFWVQVDGAGVWSVTGNSAAQIAADEDKVSLEAGMLWQRVTRENTRLGLRAEVTSFVPVTTDQVELMQVTLTNLSDHPLVLTPTAAIPIYGRSADNLRDHRHVTSLLHRIRCHVHGVLVRPTLSFDERGHQPNTITYAVLGAEGDGTAPVGFFPTVDGFIGEGGNLDWPQAVTRPDANLVATGAIVSGSEAFGGLRFRPIRLAPGEARSYILVLAILPEDGSQDSGPDRLVKTYASASAFESHFLQNQKYWLGKQSTFAVHTGDSQFDGWMQWVNLQPTLRRLFGNSFLPYHDYGRGGRGWRDLWQDVLALMLVETGPVDALLFSNFAGVRMDGSNATIIGSRPGEFKADRNNIPRVWMDHGAWPWLTTKLYLDQTGDLAFLLREQSYFKDLHIGRCSAHDSDWNESQGTEQRRVNGSLASGTVLEHLLLQHLTAFFNVGEHNNLRLEGADWNDGMDMARQRGESVAFTALYASNLRQLSEIVLDLETLGATDVELAAEILPLLDTLNKSSVDYASPAAKLGRLASYFDSVRHTVSGEKVHLSLKDLSADLRAKADWLTDHLRRNEWLTAADGSGWFNGYYDNDGHRLEGENPKGLRITLTGQVFPLMGGIATDEQARRILQTADRHLFDPSVGGYRLNTDFGEVLHNMGRCFGFAFGTKENGAMFSHMAVMYAFALFSRGFVQEGYRVLDTIYRHCSDFPVSRIYPGLPEYFDPDGRGLYPYLTGSASWYLLTLVTQAFGVRGQRGDLLLDPKLVRTQFDVAGNASVTTLFAGQRITVVYQNPSRLECGSYRVGDVTLDGNRIEFTRENGKLIIPREAISKLEAGKYHILQAMLVA
jgi:cellobiose phosphorylase